MKKLKELRKQNYMTQTQLGKLTGLSTSAISLYESGVHEPDLATLKRFADIFNVSLDELLRRRKKMIFQPCGSNTAVIRIPGCCFRLLARQPRIISALPPLC